MDASSQASAAHDSRRLSSCRRHGSFQVFRPSAARCVDGPRIEKSPRQDGAQVDRTLLASGRDGRWVFQASTEGTPQGGPASPLLANILLDDLDKELEGRGLPFVRYADDFVIFTKSKRSAERVFGSVQSYLTNKLRLVVNLEKSRIVPTSELEHLVFSFVGSRATINVSSKSIERFKHRIREITGRSRGISMERRVCELQRFVRGWMGYYGIASQLKLFARLEQCGVISCGRPGPAHSVLLLDAGGESGRASASAYVQVNCERSWINECLVSRTRSFESEDVMV